MIGNDIVDLALAKKESNWKRNRFLDKIFTQKEQLLIANAINPEIMIWNLWTRKEAAYKIVKAASITVATSAGFNPLPMSDSLLIMPQQIAMSVKISKIFGFDSIIIV